MVDKKTKVVKGIVSRVGPCYQIESVGVIIMLEGHSRPYRLNLRKVEGYLGLTKTGDHVSFSYVETGVFKKEFEFDQTSFVNHTLLEHFNIESKQEKNKRDEIVYSLENK